MILVLSEGASVVSTIEARTKHHRHYMEGSRPFEKKKAAAVDDASKTSFKSTSPLLIAHLPTLLAQKTEHQVALSTLPTLLVQKSEQQAAAKVGVKCFGICTALLIIGAVAATGGAVTAGILLSNANAGLQKLETVADSETEYGVSNCFENHGKKIIKKYLTWHEQEQGDCSFVGRFT